MHWNSQNETSHSYRFEPSTIQSKNQQNDEKKTSKNKQTRWNIIFCMRNRKSNKIIFRFPDVTPSFLASLLSFFFRFSVFVALLFIPWRLSFHCIHSLIVVPTNTCSYARMLWVVGVLLCKYFNKMIEKKNWSSSLDNDGVHFLLISFAFAVWTDVILFFCPRRKVYTYCPTIYFCVRQYERQLSTIVHNSEVHASR